MRQSLIYKSDGGNIADQKIRFLRGKVVMVFDQKSFPAHVTPGEGINRFSKFEPGAEIAGGLSTCGIFESSKPFGNLKMSNVRDNANRGVSEHRDHRQGNDMFLTKNLTASTIRSGCLAWENRRMTNSVGKASTKAQESLSIATRDPP